MTQPDWNARYSDPEYAYGVEPNSFLVENVSFLSDPVLSIAEGEGRNAVFLASRGLKVHAVDGSEVGLAKAEKLAANNNISISTQVANLGHYEPDEEAYSAIVSIFAHLTGAIRTRLSPLLTQSLRPNGVLILEAYSENQIRHGTGGPRDLDMLMTCAKIEHEFPTLEPILLQEVTRDVVEGKFHTGLASVVQFIGRKRV